MKSVATKDSSSVAVNLQRENYFLECSLYPIMTSSFLIDNILWREESQTGNMLCDFFYFLKGWMPIKSNDIPALVKWGVKAKCWLETLHKTCEFLMPIFSHILHSGKPGQLFISYEHSLPPNKKTTIYVNLKGNLEFKLRLVSSPFVVVFYQTSAIPKIPKKTKFHVTEMPPKFQTIFLNIKRCFAWSQRKMCEWTKYQNHIWDKESGRGISFVFIN